MQKKTRKSYTDEFKIEAARNLGVHHSLIRRWILDQLPETKIISNETVQLKAELKRVKRENEQLRMEREILKKAAAFFVKESA